jgi:predicted HNH restriction endonuclease
LEVHHIQPAYLFNGDHDAANQLSNLICLCVTCHKKAEKGSIAIQPKLI